MDEQDVALSISKLFTFSKRSARRNPLIHRVLWLRVQCYRSSLFVSYVATTDRSSNRYLERVMSANTVMLMNLWLIFKDVILSNALLPLMFGQRGFFFTLAIVALCPMRNDRWSLPIRLSE